MTAATPLVLGVTLTAPARRSTHQLTHEPYRDTDTGTWCRPKLPHVDGRTCTAPRPGPTGRRRR